MVDPRAPSVERFLSLEAALVDDRRWDDWLALFAEDVEFWVPAWDSETEPTNDANSELSLIYYPGRFGLEDRVFRLRSGSSTASTPSARTCHLVTNILPTFLADGSCEVRASWQTNVYRLKKSATYYGSYQYLLEPRAESWIIKKKRILVFNDLIPSTLDFYSI